MAILAIYFLVATVVPPLVFRNYSYEIDDMGVSRVEGVFFKSKKTLPYNTITRCYYNTGPILNKFILA